MDRKKTQLKDFEVVCKIGDGSFSQVFLVKRQKDQTLYALKQVRLNLLSEKEKLGALNEVRLLASFRSANIIALKETFIESEQHLMCIVLEYA